MELFGRFPHLVENIFGQLDGETLFRCSHINKIWNGNLEEYRIHLVKNIQKLLKNPGVAYGNVEKSPIAMCPTRTLGLPTTHEMKITVEQLPLPLLIQFLRYFCERELKDYEVYFRIVCIKKTSVFLGIFIKNEENGGELVNKQQCICHQEYYANLIIFQIKIKHGN